MRLICVIMREEAPDQFLDTQKLFDYGFNQFQKMNVADNEKNYMLDAATFFRTNYDIIGSSKPILSINPNGYIVIPKICDFTDADVAISYSGRGEQDVATLTYTIDDHFVGDATIDYADNSTKTFEFANILIDSEKVIPQKVLPDHKIIFIDTNKLILRVVFCLICIFAVLVIIYGIRKYVTSGRRRQRMKRKRFKKWNKKLF